MIDRKSTRLNSSHTVIYTLSLHDALPISWLHIKFSTLLANCWLRMQRRWPGLNLSPKRVITNDRSEEHTSELQSHSDLHSFPTRRSSDLMVAHQVLDIVGKLLAADAKALAGPKFIA